MSSPRTFLCAMILQTSGKRACSFFPSAAISYEMIMQGECNGKVEKQSFYNFDTAEPKLILCNDIANEWKESLLFIYRVQLYHMQR